MGVQSFPNILTMNILLLLSAFSLISCAPTPQEEDLVPYVHQEIEALPYVHDVTGDVSDDSSPEALPYVHDVTGDVSDDSSPEAIAYVHDLTGDASDDTSPEALPYVHEEPVQVAVPVPVLSYGYAPTGCVNSLGSVVPCNV